VRGVSGEVERVIPPRHYARQVSMKTGSFRKDRPGRVAVTISARRTSVGPFIGLPQAGPSDCTSASYCTQPTMDEPLSPHSGDLPRKPGEFCSLSAAKMHMPSFDWVRVSRSPVPASWFTKLD
jgi:hypothetical protein